MRSQVRWRGLVNVWVLGGALLFGLLLFVAAFGLLWLSRPTPAPVLLATAIVNVIPAPSDTPSPLVMNTGVPTEMILIPTPTRLLPPAPAPGVINLGDYVQITGTGGDGLRLRANPGLAGDVRLLGAEAEVFQVTDGPRDTDGYQWWFLVGLYDPNRRGWAVSNYLGVIQKP
jgi:hypothetical protein